MNQQGARQALAGRQSATPARPSVNATSDTRSSAGRSGASAIDNRVDRAG